MSLDGVCFYYPLAGAGVRQALRDVSLEVKKDEALLILGPAGAGKTTLAHLLAGVSDPTSGRVTRHGEQAGGGLPVGLVTQNPEDTFTSPLVREEMGVVLQNLGWDDVRVEKAVGEMMAAVGLTEYSDHPPALLSGGQKQLLSLASIMIAEPALLVLDEPLSLLDHDGREEVSRLIAIRARQGIRSMVSLSSQVEDVRQADRVVVLAGGRIVWEGEPGMFPLDEGLLSGWGLVLPDLNRLSSMLFPEGATEKAKLWRPGEMAHFLCRSG